MSKLKLVLYPASSLQQPSQKVDDLELAKKLVPDMIDTMLAEKGIGLAAPQIGQNIRLAIINKDADKSLADHLVIINPKIFSASEEMNEDEEGCLSIPDFRAIVPRHKKIKVRFLDGNGLENKLKATGLLSRVLQHEIDHLDGVLITDRAVKTTKRSWISSTERTI